MKPIIFSLSIIACSLYSLGQDNFIEEEISFMNEGVELKGTLLIPDQTQKSPAIVFLHGSGPHERAGFRTYALEFARLGFASLFFDKRGTGSSGGSWITASLEDLAKDGVSAINYLKERKEIDATRIGFWGVSQAGWVAPYAASISDDVAFMVLISGGGASPYESELHSYKAWFSAMNFTTEEVKEGVALIDSYMKYLSTGENRDELADRLDTTSNENVKMLANKLSRILPSEKNRSNWEWVATYDPADDLRELKIPVLIMTGDKDSNHPSEMANNKWRQAFKENPELLSIVSFPGSGHGIRVGGHHHGASAKFADGYWEAQIGWLLKNVVWE